MLFSLYGLEIDVPKEMKIQIFKGSLYYEGTAEFMDYEKNVIKMDWIDLNNVIKNFPTPADFFKDNFDKIKKDPNIEFSLEQYPCEIEGHPCDFHKFTYTTKRKFPKKEIHDYIIGLGVYCFESNRFILIQYRPPEKGAIEEQAKHIIGSFRCRHEPG